MSTSISSLTLRQKVELLSGASFWSTRAIEQEGIQPIVLTDGPHGVRYQRATGDHLGINDSEPATSFPTASSTGSSWDPELLEEMGTALGREARALGVSVLLGPGVNIKRSPLCGRNFEYFSEDPLLSGMLGAAWVRGVQAQGVGASVKHFAANNQETDRMRISAEVDERTLREIYLAAFERVVTESAPATVMCSYNKINGVYASENTWLLTDVLRKEWDFQGYVVSDWGAVSDPVAAVSAGLDLEMPGTGDTSPSLLEKAVRDGNLSGDDVDRAATRILAVHDTLSQSSPGGDVDFDAHHSLARRVAVAGTVLLANDDQLLPLNPEEGGSIAVIGEFARTPRYQGAGSSHIVPTRLDTALDAIRAATSRPVDFAPGFTLDGSADGVLHEEAIDLAQRSDVVVLFLGLPDSAESEGFDREHLLLPQPQRDLLAGVAAVTSRVVVVLSNGSVVSLESVRRDASAILEMWLGGQASGTAAADMLFGSVEPGGRLAETIPLKLEHTPAHVNWPGTNGIVRYGEGTAVGYRWYDSTDREVAYPFGYGLGYTTFSREDLDIETTPGAATATVRVTVRNTGTRTGSDVVQLYVKENEPSTYRVPWELRAFTKVTLDPGEEQVVHFELTERDFAFWSANGWTVNPGAYTIAVGAHSRDLTLQEVITLDLPQPVAKLTPESTVGEWFTHPAGGPVLQNLFSQRGGGATLTPEREEFKMMESMPLRTLIGFGAGTDGAPDAATVVASLLEQVREVSVA